MKQSYWGEYVPIDLHVHTPASECYYRKYDSLEDEYMNLVKMYVEKDVKVIAITDHNSIKGYKELMRIKSESENRIKYWNELGEIEELKDKICKEQEKLKIFQSILILPGIEFEAFPGIHILLIFDSQIDGIIKEIEEFIYENGYSVDNQGRENVDVSCVSAVEIINVAYDMGAITIAAHIDSDKGALDKLKDSGRVQFFKNEALNGVQIIKPETIDFLKSLMSNKDYKRNKELAFVRASDFHNRSCIDGKISYFRMENISFDAVKNVITEHPELISFTPRIEDVDSIKDILKNSDTISFENLKGENIKNISKAICAILNKGKGAIVIGIGNKGSIVGIKKPIKEIESEITSIYDAYNNNMAYFKHVEDYYELGELVVVITRIWSIVHIIFEYNNEVYLFDEKNRVKKASVNEIFELGEKNYRDSFIRIDNMNHARIKYIEEQTELIDNSRNNVELNRKILKYSVIAQNVFNTNIIMKGPEIEYDFDGLGIIDGNLFHVPMLDAHYSDCYSRLTCPSFKLDFDEKDIETKHFYEGECAIVSSRFDVHYIISDSKYLIDGAMFIIFSFNEYLRKQYSLPAIVLWLKSPIFLYHQYTINGNYELFSPKLFLEVPIFLHEEMLKGNFFDKIATEIIELEKQFLVKRQGMTEEQLDSFMKDHNACVLECAWRAEKEFMKILDISETEYASILEFTEKENWSFFNQKYEEITKEEG